MHKFIISLVLLSFVVRVNADDNLRTTALTVNLLLHADLVLLDGYPVNMELYEAVNSSGNFQFTEIASKKPLFGWVLKSNEINTLQSAYRVIVGTNKENVKNNVGDMWDSGKTESDQSINIRHRGSDLQENTVYFWKVKTWNNHGHESPFSEIKQFKTASTLVSFSEAVYPGTSTYPLQKTDKAPQEITYIDSTRTLIDFGKANFGQMRITLFGTPDMDTIRLHLGEKLTNGMLDRNPGASIRFESFKIVAKPGWNTYKILIPSHYYDKKPDRIIRMPEYIGKVMPFRYCEIENYPGRLLSSDKIQQITIHYPFNDEASYFHSSDTVLNAVWAMCKHTIKASSFCGIYVDGDRERFPREADSYVNQMSHYGVEREFSLARHTHEFQIKYASQWTEWIMHVVLIAWADFMETGDASSLAYFYDDLKAKTLIALARNDGLISTRTGLVDMDVINSVHWQKQEWIRQKKDQPSFRDIVDWPQSGKMGLSSKQGETDGFIFGDINTVVNAFHYRTLVLMAEIASVLNKMEDANFYAKRAAQFKATFNKVFLDSKTNIYKDGEGIQHSSLHANMFPVAFGLAPENYSSSIMEFIKSRGLACSPYGSLYLFESLYNMGEADYALDLLRSTSERSWGRWIYEFGSTIALEAWGPEFKPNLDWSHAWGSAPASVIPRKLMGIEPLEPGYRKISIKPQLGSLGHAEIKLSTIRGDVKVSFLNKPGEKFELKVSIPANMQADVYLPRLSTSDCVLMNDKPVSFTETDSFIVVENVGSGNYIFSENCSFIEDRK